LFLPLAKTLDKEVNFKSALACLIATVGCLAKLNPKISNCQSFSCLRVCSVVGMFA
jgi:hypothetical protein